MPSGSAALLTAADWDAVRVFAERAGMEPAALVRLAVRALAEHVRVHGSLLLPVRLGALLPDCVTCPAYQSAQQSSPPAGSADIIPGPWAQQSREH